MFHRCRRIALLLALATTPLLAHAQRSLAPISPSGQTVTPVFEGWYHNRDGTYSISFGYFNRNSAEQVDVPVGDANFIAPGVPNQGQPTHFAARRHWGVFAVVVPADFGTKKVVWTLKDHGQTFAIAGSLREEWEIDAIEGEASADNTPPTLSFAGSAEGQGPLGVTAGPLRIVRGQPLTLQVLVKDDGKTGTTNAAGVRVGTPVDLTWFLHQGDGEATFSTATTRLSPTGGTGTTTVTFNRVGEYVVRVRANDTSAESAGHAQCCWTNGFVKVTVTP